MIINEQNLEESYAALSFYWELGKTKTENVEEYRYNYDYSKDKYECVPYTKKIKTFIPQKTVTKIAYGDAESAAQNRVRLGKIMKSFIFYTDDDYLYVQYAKMENNTKRGEEYKPYWDVYSEPLYRISRDKTIEELYRGNWLKTRNLKFESTNWTAQKVSDIKETFEYFFGSNCSWNGSSVNYERDYNIIGFLKYKPARVTQKKKSIIDDVIRETGRGRLEIKENDEFFARKMWGEKQAIVLDKAPNGCGYLFRIFGESNEDNKLIEVGRKLKLFGKDAYLMYSNGEWAKSSSVPHFYCIYTHNFYITDAAKEEYKYKMPLINRYVEKMKLAEEENNYYIGFRLSMVISLLENDLYEQLFKVIKNEHALNILVCCENLSTFFGEINQNGKTIYAKLGVNKYQFDKFVNGIIQDCPACLSHLISNVKNILRKDNISNLSNEAFDLICGYLKSETFSGNSLVDRIANFAENAKKAFDYDLNYALKVIKFVKNEYELETRKDTSRYYVNLPKFELLCDYIRSLKTLKESDCDISEFPKFPENSSLGRYHDYATEKVIECRDKLRFIKFQKVMAKRKKLGCTDGQYSIMLPENGSDLVREGSLLHHCVGSYADRVANGYTTIVFLRKNKDVNTPFYTIEVDNNDQIIQIHGANNKWLGNDPDVIPFVAKWIKENKLKCDKKILLSCSQSYYERDPKYLENIYGL